MRMAVLTFCPAASKASRAVSWSAWVARTMMRMARSYSLRLETWTSTIRLPYTLPMRIMVPVDSILSTSFWAVPDFMRVEPRMTSGPTTGAMATSHSWDRGVSLLLTTAIVAAPASRAAATAPST